jgi:hypothetical protein
MSPRLRQWYEYIHGALADAALTGMSNKPTEEDIVHNVEWRSASRTPHAYNTIRHAEQVKGS